MISLKRAVMGILIGNRMFHENVTESFQALSGASTILRVPFGSPKICVNVIETSCASLHQCTDKSIKILKGGFIIKVISLPRIIYVFYRLRTHTVLKDNT